MKLKLTPEEKIVVMRIVLSAQESFYSAPEAFAENGKEKEAFKSAVSKLKNGCGIEETSNMTSFVCSQLETCHANDDADAVYAYFRTEPNPADWEEAVESEQDGSIGLIKSEACGWEEREEVPTPLSKASGFKRYYLGGAG